MTPTTRAALQTADHATKVEHLPGFDWRAEMARAEELRVALQDLLQRPVTVDDSVQDASFFTELMVIDPEAKPENGVLSNLVLGVRLSSFGRLSTIWSCCQAGRELPVATVQGVVDLLRAHDYTFVPADELEAPYDGSHAGFRATGATWWGRFFDYT